MSLIFSDGFRNGQEHKLFILKQCMGDILKINQIKIKDLNNIRFFSNTVHKWFKQGDKFSDPSESISRASMDSTMDFPKHRRGI